MGEFLKRFQRASLESGYVRSIQSVRDTLVDALFSKLRDHLRTLPRTDVSEPSKFQVLILGWPHDPLLFESMNQRVKHHNQSDRLAYKISLLGNVLNIQRQEGYPQESVVLRTAGKPRSEKRENRALTPENLIVHSLKGSRKFDAVLVLNALEHADEPELLVGQIKSRLNENGALFVAAHQEKSPALVTAADRSYRLRSLAVILMNSFLGRLGNQRAIREIRELDLHKDLNYSSATALLDAFHQDGQAHVSIPRAVNEGYVNELPDRMKQALHSPFGTPEACEKLASELSMQREGAGSYPTAAGGQILIHKLTPVKPGESRLKERWGKE